MKKTICTAVLLSAFCLLLSGCSGSAGTTSSPAGTDAAVSQSADADAQQSSIDYLVLVNKENPLPEEWESTVETVHVQNSLGDDVEVEKKAYEAYLDLKAALEQEGIRVDLDSARRSVAEQQRIVDDFTEKYGENYVKNYVAVPGYSEHHTGLALDLYLNIDGEDVYLNEDMVQYPEIWEQIHAKLADHGFILRYLDGREAITGYSYEPWHIRYVDDPAIAKEIMEKDMTLEEYLGRLPVSDVTPPKEDADGFSVAIHTEGLGQIAYAEEGETPEFDDAFPMQDALLDLTGDATYVFAAKADDGSTFLKWTKDGNDYSTDEQITVTLSEDAEYTAVFEMAE